MAGHYSKVSEGLIKPPSTDIHDTRVKRANSRVISKFPEDIGPHSVVMVFREYQFATSPTGASGKTFTAYSKLNSATDNPLGAIVLPLPTNLEDSYNVRLSTPDLAVGGQLKAQGIASGDSETFTAAELATLGASMKNPKGGLYNFSKGAGTVLGSFADEFALADLMGLDSIAVARIALKRWNRHNGVGEGFGSVVNPFVALSFQGVELKKHTFTWQLSPKNPEESTALNHIIKLIKKAAAPEYTTTNSPTTGTGTATTAATVSKSVKLTSSRLLLKYPSMVDLWFTGIDPAYYYYFKRCMINDVTVNFNPTGLHTILKGGKPSFIQLSMSLTESQIHTKADYDDVKPAPMYSEPDY